MLDNIYADLLTNKEKLDSDMLSPEYNENIYINEDILYNEMNQVINRLQCNKSVGIDHILKYDDIKKAPVTFFNCCFNCCFSLGLVPSLWLK